MKQQDRLAESRRILEYNYQEAMFRTLAGKLSNYWKYTKEDKQELQAMYLKNRDGVMMALKDRCKYIDNLEFLKGDHNAI